MGGLASGSAFPNPEASQMQMLPEGGWGEAEVDEEGAEFPVARGDFIEAHFIHDFLHGIQLMGHERDAPFPTVQAG